MASGFGRTGESQYWKEDHVRRYEVPDGASGIVNAALWAAPVVNSLPRFMKYNDLDDWGKGRELPEFASESFNEMWKKNKVQGKEESK